MASTDLCKCLIRQQLIKLTPEEKVRQFLIQRLLDLGYPKGLIAVEKKVRQRRFDLVCYGVDTQPLLLIECKSGAFKEDHIRQVFGYNDETKAPFVALVNENKTHTYWMTPTGLQSVPFIPTYRELYGNSRRH